MTTAISPIPTCCRWKSSRPGSTASPPACRNCPTPRRRGSSADFGLTDYDASVLTAEVENADYFEAVAAGPRRQAGGELGDQRAVRPAEEGRPRASPTARSRRRSWARIIDLIGSGEISGKIAKDLFEIVYTEGGDPAAIVEARGMKQVTDTGAIEALVDEVIAANPDQVEKARANPKLAGWFVGQVLKASGGKANPALVNELVARKLGL